MVILSRHNIMKNKHVIKQMIRKMHDRKLPSIKKYNWTKDQNKTRIGTISPNKKTIKNSPDKLILKSKDKQ